MAGFAAVGATVVASAVLAVRVDSQAILAVAYGLGLATPLIFSTGSKQYELLATYLVVLQVGASAVLYVAKRGGDWHAPRLVGLGGMWLLLLLACIDARDSQAPALMGLLVAAFVTSTVWTTLPKHPNRPALMHVMWGYYNAVLSVALAVLWVVKLDLDGRQFAGVLLVQAVVNLATLPYLRRRSGDRKNDAAPIALAALYIIIAVPVGLELDTASIVWCLLALAGGGASFWANKQSHAETKTLAALAYPMAIVASVGWLLMLADRPHDASAVANIAFADGVMCTIAWALLTKTSGAPRVLAFVAAEIAFHVTLGIEAFFILEASGERVAFIASTVIIALSAGVQFVASFRARLEQARGLAIASYVLFAIAAAKLIFLDLQGAGTVVRALAALGIGRDLHRDGAAGQQAPPRRRRARLKAGRDLARWVLGRGDVDIDAG